MKIKQKVVYKDYFKFIEEWRSGISNKFKPGDIVRSKAGGILGAVQTAAANYGQYHVKVRISDKPWEFREIMMNELTMVKVDEPNPFKYKYSDMVPGPSSIEIDKLNAKIAIAEAKKAKERTAKDVEKYLAALEEEMIYKKEMHKLEDKDKIISEEDEEAGDVAQVDIDPIALKREKIISGE